MTAAVSMVKVLTTRNLFKADTCSIPLWAQNDDVVQTLFLNRHRLNYVFTEQSADQIIYRLLFL